MELTIVAVYTIIDDLLISLGHHTHPQAKMSDAELIPIQINLVSLRNSTVYWQGVTLFGRSDPGNAI